MVGGGVAAGVAVAGNGSSSKPKAGAVAPVGVAASTIAEWKFAEGRGSETYDSTDDGHDGSLQAGASWGPGAPGQSGHSITFSSGAKVVVDTAPDLDLTGAIAIDTWVQLAAGPQGGQTLLDKGSYAVRISSGGLIGLEWDGRWLQSRPLTWSHGTWYQVTVDNDGETTTFSRDGKSVGSAVTPGPTSTNSDPLLIGSGLRGAIGYLALSAPADRRAPVIVGASLDASAAQMGSPVTVDATVDGSWSNPDDPSQVDLSAQVTTPSGAQQTVDGFMFQNFTAAAGALVPTGTPDWQVRYTPTADGQYRFVLGVTTASGRASSAPLTLTVSGTAPGYRGFVEVDPTNHDYYTWSRGQSFFGVGADLDFPEFTKFTCDPGGKGPNDVCLARESPTRGILGDGTNKPATGMTPEGLYSVYESYITAVNNLAAVGCNSGRLRLDSRFIPLELDPTYTGMPGYPHGVPDFALGRYNDVNAWIADQVIDLAAKDGMALQVTAWNADQLPWGSQYADSGNATLVQRRLRYEVARWGYSPSVLSWEMFNELGSKKAMNSPFWEHQISYLRSIDINHHVVTNSYEGIDTVESHVYIAATGSFKALTKIPAHAIKPHNVSEYGQNSFYNEPADYDPTGSIAHDGEWSALIGERSGAWYWWLVEQIVPENLYQQVFKGISAFTAGENLGASSWHEGKITLNGVLAPESYALSNGSRALVWLEAPTPGQSLSLHGLTADHSYAVQWWNTITGQVISATTGQSDASGAVTLDVPDGITGDVAAKVF